MVTLAQKLLDNANTNNLPPHLIIEARAGTGKTTTLIEGLNVLKGIEPRIKPSDQQSKIWAALSESISEGKSLFEGSVCFVAFNKSIATELKQRVPAGVEAMTMHSLGYRAVCSAFGRLELNSYRVQNNLAKYLEVDIRDLKRKDTSLVSVVEYLTQLCKMNLLGTFETLSLQDMYSLVDQYGLTYEGNWNYVHELVVEMLKMSLDVESDRMIDFNDQIWLPIALNLPIKKFDLLLVDEAQDLNKCQHALTFRSGKRLVYCGDPRQAIYGFTGADCSSIPNLYKDLAESAQGCTQLFLTKTYRCGKAIVKNVNRLVPDLEAAETNCEGTVYNMNVAGSKPLVGDTPEMLSTRGYRHKVQAQDMVLCRVNAPIVSECFKFLSQKRRATIQGRDIGQSLISTIKGLKVLTTEQLVVKLDTWYEKQRAKELLKKFPDEAKLMGLEDRYNCITIFCADQETVEGVIKSIEEVFTDTPGNEAIRFSSIHKAKGLEAKRVFLLLLKEAPIPHPMAKTKEAKEQEYNLLYVAETRAIEELILVSGTIKPQASPDT